MKGELGSISRSQSVIDESSMASVDDSNRSCWANLPPELLRDVLIRVEASGCTWPSRKNVIACAGVCRSWRKNMKEIVQHPEVSGKLTFPISLIQPGSRSSPIACIIRRDHRSQMCFYLGLDGDDYRKRANYFPGENFAKVGIAKFLLAAKRCRRPTCTDYIISLNSKSITKVSSTFIGKLRSNFLGTKFRVYDAQPSNTSALATKSHLSSLGSIKRVSSKFPTGNYPVSSISYDVNVLGPRGPRQMQCLMNTIPADAIEPGGVAPTPTEFPLRNLDSTLFRSKSAHPDNPQLAQVLVLKNKAPTWNPDLQCWCLDFKGQVSLASVKNFQLVACLENKDGVKEYQDVILQFGRVGKDLFTMSYKYPLSAFQAFAICLSSFETKLACE